MVPILFLKGWMIGFSMAIPVGPIAMVCIRHSLLRGTLYGLAAGLGAALADAFYGIIAGFGMTIVCDFLSNYHSICHLVGALFLCYLGVKTLQAKPREKSEEEMIPLSYKRVFIVTFFLTLTNPLTILGFIGIYAVLGIAFFDEILSPLSVTGGIFLGSLAWWLLLSFFSSLIGRKANFKSTRLLNKISGSAFLAFGIIAGLTALQKIAYALN